MSESAEPLLPSKRTLPRVSLWEIFLAFLLIGATSFGGGVVAYLRNTLVTTKAWLDDEEFLAALEISQALPGLNATNMSVIVGDRLRGPIGGIIAFLGMTLPGGALVFALGLVYATHHENEHVTSVLKGVAAASVGLLLSVTLQLGHKQLAKALDLSLVIATVVLVSILKVSLLYVLLILIPIAVFLYRPHAHKTPLKHRELDKRPAD